MASKIKLIITGLITGIIIFAGGIFTGITWNSSDDKPPIKRKEVTETKWKDEYASLKKKFDTLKKKGRKEKVEFKEHFTIDDFEDIADGAFSPINFRENYRTEYSFLIFKKYYLDVTAYDDLKEATARYEIGTKNNWRVYLIWAGIGAAVTAGTVWYYNR